MARPKRQIETPGATAVDENTSDAQLLNSIQANTPEQLNAATAGATVLPAAAVTSSAEGETGDTTTTAPTPEAIAARNEALSGLNAKAFQLITKFEAYGFTDEHDNPLTNCLDFIELVKPATTIQSTSAAIVTEDGLRKAFSAPVLTDHGWLVK
ncbi:hypothetical protein H2Y57_05180 [Pectobacterium aroidearum]|uniref:Uncharacterized protein n=1 Tax=Pectobacterium aroidearum TaxID=1201031 RepID=A0AAW3STW8_9GAMM|nr:hypothetical protein [Pectobacterium aroidearum]MBA5203079.1 hypothetical protein [Pectobacterium aroidearum]